MKRTALAGAAVVALLTAPLAALAQAPARATAPAAATAAPAAPRPLSVADGFTFAATGDLLGPNRPVVPRGDADFGKVLKIIQGADAAFANHEGTSFDYGMFDGWEGAENGGGYPRFTRELIEDYKAAGIDMMSVANNHAADFGTAGMIATAQTLNDLGVVHAGSGLSLQAARSAAFFETPKGRIGLVATASSFAGMSPAGDAPPNLRPRPGISVIRTTAVARVTPEQMAVLKPVAEAQGWDLTPNVSADGKSASIGRQRFEVSDKPGFTYRMNKEDADGVAKAITAAKQQSDMVVLSIHAHETESGGSEGSAPADFLPVLFHQAIDSGADMVIRHGPHALKGVEIYKGKPIFYGMGSLFFNVGGVRKSFGGTRMPDTWYDSAIAVSEVKGGKIATVRIYPITMRIDASPMMGTPRLASPEDGRRILDQMQKDSEMFGTKISIENGIGVIRIVG
jgi:poly-gamma-glutamate capsule biosynthesis protein CapA/YwtB (metallophosphatase superfamily)